MNLNLSPEIIKTLLGLAALSTANALFGVLVAAKARAFDWQRLSNYLHAMLIELASLLVLAALASATDGQWMALFATGAAAVGARLTFDIKDKFFALVRTQPPAPPAQG